MKRSTTYALGAAALVAVGAIALTATSLADNGWYHHRHHGWGEGMDGEMGWRGGPGPRSFHMLEMFDANNDGKVTQDEIDTTRQTRFKTFDKDGDGTLSLDEFQALWLDTMREHMVDRFQDLDADGDAKVTTAEFGRQLAHMVQFMDRNGDGVIDAADMRPPHRMGDADRDEEPDGGEQ